MVFMNLFEIFNFTHRKQYHISIPRYQSTSTMELPHSSQQKGSQTAADGVRKLESEMQPIEPKFYLPGTWTRNSSHAVGQVQFSKFVTFMIARFRSQNGRLDEVPLFVNLLNTEGSFDFMTPALEQIPEFKMEP